MILTACLAVLAIAQGPQISPKADSVRQEITDGYIKWGNVRKTFDRKTADTMLAPDFYVQLQDRRLTRDQFLGMVGATRQGASLTRFDSKILTLEKEQDTWVAVITEKLEVEYTDKQGKPGHAYSYWVTKDGWHKENGKWSIKYSQEIGSQNWLNQKPPIDDWAA